MCSLQRTDSDSIMSWAPSSTRVASTWGSAELGSNARSIFSSSVQLLPTFQRLKGVFPWYITIRCPYIQYSIMSDTEETPVVNKNKRHRKEKREHRKLSKDPSEHTNLYAGQRGIPMTLTSKHLNNCYNVPIKLIFIPNSVRLS